MEYFFNSISDQLIKMGLSRTVADYSELSLKGIFLLLIIWSSFMLCRKLFIPLIYRLLRQNKIKWDDFLLQHHVFRPLMHIAPIVLLHFFIPILFGRTTWPETLFRFTDIYLLTIVLVALGRFLDAFSSYYQTLSYAATRPVKGYIQMAKIIIYLIGILWMVSILLNKQIQDILVGLGAVIALVLLIFRDTILGLVSSMQLAANDMVNIGDWISMPSRGADGPVIDISLYTVKVQNWDKTIATIPTWAMVNESFINWRGMEESQGRRIKRSININLKAISLVPSELAEHLLSMDLTSPYLEDSDFSEEITNVGIFRIFAKRYLKEHPAIEDGMTFMVRQLQPTEKGLPLEIYAFSKQKAWVHYEEVQAKLIEFLLAILPLFKLQVFQAVSGDDITETLKQLDKKQ